MMTVVFSPHLPAGRREGKEERGREEGVHAESHELASFQTRDSLMNEWFLPFTALANAHVDLHAKLARLQHPQPSEEVERVVLANVERVRAVCRNVAGVLPLFSSSEFC